MSIDGRLNRLMPTLTARERGILVLRSLPQTIPTGIERIQADQNGISNRLPFC